MHPFRMLSLILGLFLLSGAVAAQDASPQTVLPAGEGASVVIRSLTAQTGSSTVRSERFQIPWGMASRNPLATPRAACPNHSPPQAMGIPQRRPALARRPPPAANRLRAAAEGHPAPALRQSAAANSRARAERRQALALQPSAAASNRFLRERRARVP